jgi:hypothetical protein
MGPRSLRTDRELLSRKGAAMRASRKFDTLDQLRSLCALEAPPVDDLARPVSGECWVWPGALTAGGYGNVKHNGTYSYVHRVAARMSGMEIGDLHIDHLCRRRSCCNPSHLEAVSIRENLVRGAQCIRARTGKCGVCGSDDLRLYSQGLKCRTCHNIRQRKKRDLARTEGAHV